MLFRKVFLWFLLLLLILQSIYHYTGVEDVKLFIYTLEILFISSSLFVIFQKKKRITRKLFYLLLLALVFLFGFVLNGKSDFQDIVKMLGSIVIFLSAYYLYSETKEFSKKEKRKVILIALIPFGVYLIDTVLGFRETSNSLSLFSNSNNYILFSICCLWLMMLYNISNRLILSFFGVSFAITSTLGAFIAIALATIFHFRDKILKPRFFFLFLILIIFSGSMIIYSDLYLFERLRGTGNMFYVLMNDYNLKELSDVSFGEAMAISGSNDGNDVSFLFRIKLWTESLNYFFDQSILYLLFGLGFGSIPAINRFGLVAHNDYLTWFIESGLVGFIFIVTGIWFGFLKLKNTVFIIPYLALLLYFFSENLFYNFYAMAIFAFCLATSLCKIKNENITD